MEELTLRCKCHHPMHDVVLQDYGYDHGEPEMWVFSQLSRYLPWYKRFWLGIRYALGFTLDEPAWAELLVDYKQILELKRFVDELAKKADEHSESEELRLIENIKKDAAIRREHEELLEMTKLLDKHPDGYEGICFCKSCRCR